MPLKVYVAGFQGLSLVDYPKKPSCVLWFAGCNFRCPFCYNHGMWLMRKKFEVSFDKIVEAIRDASRLVDACKVTGGEPTLQPEALEKLAKTVKEMRLNFSIDTNGSHPEVLQRLKPYLDLVAVDIKAPLNEEDYGKLIGLADLGNWAVEKLAETLEILFKWKIPIELRYTVIPELNSSIDFMRKIRNDLIDLGFEEAENTYLVLAEFLPENAASDSLRKTHSPTPKFMMNLAKAIDLPRVYIRHRDLGLMVKA